MRRVHQITFVCASAGLGLLLACPSDPPDVGECGVDSCYLPCNEDNECEIDGEFCLYGETGTICLKECDDSFCPETGACVYNPGSSATPCEEGAPCAIAGETCEENANGVFVCLMAPSHCVPTCEIEDCPHGLVCDESGICINAY